MSKGPNAQEFRRPNKSVRRPVPQATETVSFTHNRMEVMTRLGHHPEEKWERDGWVENKAKSSKDGSRKVFEMEPAKFNELRNATEEKTRRREGSRTRPEGMPVGSIQVEVKREKVSGAKMRRELEANASA